MFRSAILLLAGVGACFLASCKTQDSPQEVTPAFGGPVSTIPWNQPQRWEGGAGALGALRGNEDR